MGYPKVALVWQLALSGIALGSQYGLVTLAANTRFASNKAFDCTSLTLLLVSGYAFFLFNNVLTFSLVLAVLFTVLSVVAISWLFDYAFVRRFLFRKTTALDFLLATFAAYLFSESLVIIAFGSDTRAVLRGPSSGIPVLGAYTTAIQVTAICAFLCASLCYFLLLTYSMPGRSIRAFFSNEQLAGYCGIKTRMAQHWAAVSAAIAVAIAGVLIACDADITPTMWLQYFIVALAVTLIGGRTRIITNAFIACGVGVFQKLSVLLVNSRWEHVFVYAVLLTVFTLRRKALSPQATA